MLGFVDEDDTLVIYSCRKVLGNFDDLEVLLRKYPVDG
jgi:hypothetical protein